jgi:hypothetical protein
MDTKGTNHDMDAMDASDTRADTPDTASIHASILSYRNKIRLAYN